jgi:putative ABC transport system ATP-binding protein
MNEESMSTSLVALERAELTLNSDAGPVDILRGIDLAVDAGETLGIVGPSGSGKTSLLMIIAGLERVTGGSIAMGGISYAGMNEDALARLRGENIGIVFQDFHLIPNMTALENVALPLELAGIDDAFDRARAALDEVGLQHRHVHYPGQLSGGEQQRVALARALGPAPKLILADEPTGNLDGETGDRIMELIFDVHARKGTTLILVTHEERLAARCGRRVVMADGRITRDERAPLAAD